MLFLYHASWGGIKNYPALKRHMDDDDDGPPLERNDRHARSVALERTRSTCLTLIVPTLFGAKHPEIQRGMSTEKWLISNGKHPKKAIQNISNVICVESYPPVNKCYINMFG